MSQPNLAEQTEEADAVDVEPTLEQPQPEVELPTQKQKTDIYTVMLIISLLCLLVACILLFVELNRWGTFPGTPWNTDEATVQMLHDHDQVPHQLTVAEVC